VRPERATQTFFFRADHAPIADHEDLQQLAERWLRRLLERGERAELTEAQAGAARGRAEEGGAR
jgi:hypothetical protein